MTFSELRRLWRADLYRYRGEANARLLLSFLLLHPGYKYTFTMRLCRFLKERRRNPALLPFFLLVRLLLRRYRYRYGIDIPASATVGPGLYINHPGDIVVHSRSTIGSNCNLSHGVTLGEANRGRNKGFPTVSDGVYIGPGAKLVGAVRVGDNVAIGANSVVTTDIPPGSVAAGVPARVISSDGAVGYVNNTDW
jgi:serine O-acetyltransferase